MQADGGLVQNVHDAHQTGADLTGQTNALRFSARERLGTAIQREVVEPYIDQKTVAGTQLLENFVGDFALATCQLQRIKVRLRVTDRQRSDAG